jgi:hypothetical protein
MSTNTRGIGFGPSIWAEGRTDNCIVFHWRDVAPQEHTEHEVGNNEFLLSPQMTYSYGVLEHVG